MTNTNKHLKSQDAQEALDSIKKMENAGLKRIVPASRLLGAILAILIGTQIALLGAGIRTYNTILIVLIVIMTIAIINKNRSAGVTERILLSKRKIFILLCCIIPLYFSAIIGGQYLHSHFNYFWAPFVIGGIVTISIWSLIASAYHSHFNKFNKDNN